MDHDENAIISTILERKKKNWKLIPKFHIFPFMNEFLFILAKYKDDFL